MVGQVKNYSPTVEKTEQRLVIYFGSCSYWIPIQRKYVSIPGYNMLIGKFKLKIDSVVVEANLKFGLYVQAIETINAGIFQSMMTE